MKRNQVEILEFKGIITKMKNSEERPKGRFLSDRRIIDLEDKSIEIMQSEEQEKKIVNSND